MGNFGRATLVSVLVLIGVHALCVSALGEPARLPFIPRPRAEPPDPWNQLPIDPLKPTIPPDLHLDPLADRCKRFHEHVRRAREEYEAQCSNVRSSELCVREDRYLNCATSDVCPGQDEMLRCFDQSLSYMMQRTWCKILRENFYLGLDENLDESCSESERHQNLPPIPDPDNIRCAVPSPVEPQVPNVEQNNCPKLEALREVGGI